MHACVKGREKEERRGKAATGQHVRGRTPGNALATISKTRGKGDETAHADYRTGDQATRQQHTKAGTAVAGCVAKTMCHS